MARKNKVHKLPPETRRYVEQLLREDRWTLDEIVHAVKMKFPEADLSRSSVHRYTPEFAQLRERMDAINRVSESLIGGLGEGAGDKAGALLANAVTTAVTHAALKAQNDDDADIGEIFKLARAAKNALDARRISLQERQVVAREAREQALREQREKLEALGSTGAIDPAVLAQVIRAAYDL
jgi:hypothetical protein